MGNLNRHTSSGSFVIFGATSGIARAVSRALMARGETLVLVGRDESALRAEAADLRVRYGRECPVFVWDLIARDHASRFTALLNLMDRVAPGDPAPLKGLIFAPGYMPPGRHGAVGPEETRLTFEVNLVEPVVVINLFADYFRALGAGFLSVLSSVAGDRGRAGNHTYGASKAGLSAYLEGLRAAFHGTGVLVQTVKPGPVRTPMAAEYRGIPALLASPEAVARGILRGLDRRASTVYTPGYWRVVMAVIRCLPEFLARRVPG